MSWFGRKKPFSRGAEAGQIVEGIQPSPGFELLVQSTRRRRPGAVLDLGPTSTESLQYLSKLAQEVDVCDIFQDASQRGRRADKFRFEVDQLELPDRQFDIVLVWDLLHYFDLPDRRKFGRLLADLTRDQALILVLASNVAAIPPTPIHFKILTEDRLYYVLPDGRKLPSPSLHTRQVEQVLAEFEPLRSFQLRNGMQELVFRRPATEPVESPHG
ncbi:MAG: methyltransferase domain-containing protein [Thermoanaerobaculia bacterium]|nr:methyltransferase domain-containing protein [Thermoanaerobaculia bacterium]